MDKIGDKIPPKILTEASTIIMTVLSIVDTTDINAKVLTGFLVFTTSWSYSCKMFLYMPHYMTNNSLKDGG